MKLKLAYIPIFFLYFILAAEIDFAFSDELLKIRVQGVINPPIAGFIKEAIERAEKKNAEALIVLLDTPGGLDTSMRDIVKSIMESDVPIVVYVAPPGARAASAGSIILLASHIAAMAPGTNVGAAHPVTIGKEKVDKEMMKKVVRDAEAYAKSIAMKRKRNVEWASRAVRESASITAEEALKQNVIDVVANDLDELVQKIHGKTVETRTGKRTLNTKNKKVTEIEMPFKFRFLSYISDPNVAYILMMIGLYGILFEIYNPGSIFPGVIGGICLILALYSFQALPISYAGLFLIILGIIFFILELKVVSHGLLAIAGIISIVLGSIMLVDLPSSVLSISWKSILAVTLMSALFFLGVLSYAVKAQFSKVKTGKEGLVGEEGLAKTFIHDDGKVLIHGEIWNAKSSEPIEQGERVIVERVDGLILKVKKKEVGP
ncbi:MAG: nodulation protein NfeD [Desulfobacterota bacterium]|nr:nodulation protein NfeD [Thermodesulfobacteriota bacterium]MDW8002689.1 nodulation protein NfeD [Deltaproteobacteria bacterium]